MKPHIIFTNGRSGSNFIVDAINQHPLLSNYGEVLGSYMPPMKLHQRFSYGGSTVEDYLDHILHSRRHFELAQAYSAVSHVRDRRSIRRKRWNDVVSIGVKDFGIRFTEHGLQRFLAERPDIRVVSLVRDDTLRRAISVLNLRATGKIGTRVEAEGEHERLVVDVADLLERLERFETEKNEQLAMVADLAPGQLLSLTYEEFFSTEETRDRQMTQVFEHLGAEPIEITGRYRKIVSSELSDAIENHEEVVEAVTASPFARYLDAAGG